MAKASLTIYNIFTSIQSIYWWGGGAVKTNIRFLKLMFLYVRQIKKIIEPTLLDIVGVYYNINISIVHFVSCNHGIVSLICLEPSFH